MQKLIHIDNLYKTYVTHSGSFVLCIEKLHIHKGEAIGITGPSGCGKSTILEILACLTGFQKAECFTLHLGGENYTLAAAGKLYKSCASDVIRHVGFVHQNSPLFPFLTVRENILSSLLVHDEASLSLVEKMMNDMGIHHLQNMLPEAISCGERQRVALVRTLAARPEIILADEPTAALDPYNAQIVMDLLLKSTRQYNVGLVVVSHDQKLLEHAGIPHYTCTPMHQLQNVNTQEGSLYYSIAIGKGLNDAPSNTPNVPLNITASQHTDGKNVSHIAPSLGLNKKEGFSRIIAMAWKDFVYERMLSTCSIFGLTAVLIPLLILASLRFGVVELLSDRLLRHPKNLALTPYSSMRYDDAFIQSLQNNNKTQWVIPTRRFLSASITMCAHEKKYNADVVPTRSGDPLLEKWQAVPPKGEVTITHALASHFPSLHEGDSVTLVITRRDNGRLEQEYLQAAVHTILPEATDWRENIYLSADITNAIEQYRDGYAVPQFEWHGKQKEAGSTQSYAGFRLYVKTLEDVAPMRDALLAQGIETHTASRAIENIHNVQHVLASVTTVVGSVTIVGAICSLISLSLMNVRRKLALFAQCILMGFPKKIVSTYPLIHLYCVGIFSACLSVLFYFFAAQILNGIFAHYLEHGERICSIPSTILVLIILLTPCLAMLCGLISSYQLNKLAVAQILRGKQ